MVNEAMALTVAKKLLFFVTEDWYFCSHRLPLAIAARRAGFDVGVITRVRAHGETITRHGIRLIPLEMARHGHNPFADLRIVAQLSAIYRHERPDLVHHVAVKPVLYGSLAARLAGVRKMVNAMAGLGYLFVSRGWRARLLRPFVRLAMALLLRRRGTRLILQNPDDRDLFVERGIVRSDQVRIIRGSGVDPAVFAYHEEEPGRVQVVLASRLLGDKGVREFVDAARQLRAEGVDAQFVLVGDADERNPDSIPRAVLERWQREGNVEWWGRREDMPEIFRRCHIVCLPSYREGLPKVLIEAAAVGRAIVTTDVPGCREIVRHEENGLLVPPRHAPALAAALRRLIENGPERARFGRRGRERVMENFTVDSVVAQTLTLYRELLDG